MSELDKQTFGRLADINISPTAYGELVRHFNLLIQTELAQKLHENASRLGSAIALVTTGSDARLEKGSVVSPLEVIALIPEDIDPDVYQKTLTQVLNEVSPTRISKVVETKGSRMSLVHFNGTDRVQPGRIADARLLHGDQSTLADTKERLGREIISLPREKIVHRVEALVRAARSVLRTGKNRIAGNDAIHFDLHIDPLTKKGKIWFNPNANRLSFKIGPLRFVQNTLLAEEVKYTRRENQPGFINTLDANIVRRLQQLSDDKKFNLSNDAIREIMDHYAFFLRLYHQSENAYEQRGEEFVETDEKLVGQIAYRLQALMTLIDALKIQKA